MKTRYGKAQINRGLVHFLGGKVVSAAAGSASAASAEAIARQTRRGAGEPAAETGRSKDMRTPVGWAWTGWLGRGD